MKLSAWMCVAAAALLLAAGAARAAEAKVDYAKEVESVLPDLGSDDLGKRRSAQEKLGNLCLAAGRPGAEDERLALCNLLAPKLGADTPEEARVWLLRQLQLVGRAESVAAVAALLDDKTPRIRECARRALQSNSSDEAGAALRAALDKAPDAAWRIACINAVAQRRDAKAVPALAKALAGSDEACALAAAAGLGKIAGPAAAKALGAARTKADEKVRPAVLDAYLLCADRYVADGKKSDAGAIYKEMLAADNTAVARAAGLRGLAVALGDGAIPAMADAFTGKDETLRRLAVAFIREIPGAKATRAFADLLTRLDADMQVTLLGALAERGDPAAKPAVLAAAKSDSEPVRVAALKALAGVGEAADALVLAQAAATSEGAVRDAARTSLDRLGAKGADEAILAAVPGADAKVRLELIRTLGARRSAAAQATLMKLAEDADGGVRTEAIRALEAMADDKAADLLIRLVAKPKEDGERDPAEKALAAVCARAGDKDAVGAAVAKAAGEAGGPAKAALLRPLTRIGGDKVIGAVREALKDADAGVKEAAARVIADWPDDAALADMVAIAKDDPKESNQVLALRGYMRLAKDRERKEEDRLAMCTTALPLTRRPDEKKLVLGVLRELRTVEALRLAAPLMADEKVQHEAADAAVGIARRMGGKLPDEVKDAMTKAIEATKDERIRREAGEVLKKIEDQQKK